MAKSAQGISAVLITFNEARKLRSTLRALENVADEIVVMDSFSTDETGQIAEEFGATVYRVEWQGYAKTKNLGNSKASCSHILSVDADEVLDEELIHSIQELKRSGLIGAYLLNRKNFLEGKWVKHSGWYPDRKLRLFPAGKAIWEGDYVHENLHLLEEMTVSDLPGHILHHTATDAEEHLRTIRKYNELQARRMIDEGRTYNFLKSIGQAISTFVRCLLIRRGYLDGMLGWKIAVRSARGRIWRFRSYQKLIREA